MKTVIDAVNEFKGIRPLDMLGRNGWFFDVRSLQQVGFEFNGKTVCTFEEFNQCVEDCSNNFGNKTMTDVKFEFHNNPIAHTITSSNILCCSETGRVVAVFYNESDLQAATGLIKKVELINGMAYQFDVRNKTLHGVYCKYKDTLNIHQGHYFDAIICTNIQLLEVK